jgi:hypothetical protein
VPLGTRGGGLRPAAEGPWFLGRMAEWFKALVLKTSVRVTVPGVQIPLRPLEDAVIPLAAFFYALSFKPLSFKPLSFKPLSFKPLSFGTR